MQQFVQGFLQAIDPRAIIYLLVGTFSGLIIGTLPGLTATMAVAIITPLTFWLSPNEGLAMLIGVWNSAIFSGGISAILINTPGTPASIASTFDGFALTKKGMAGLALGINVVFSCVGGILGIVALIAVGFPLAKFALSFGPAEYFTLAIFGLSTMVAVSGKSILKGMIAGFLGFSIALIGLDPIFGSERFTFGRMELLGGISFIPVMIGLFGIGEVLSQIFTKSRTMSADARITTQLKRVVPTFKEVKDLTPVALLSSLIGIVIGVIPGAGADIAGLVAWDQSRRVAKKPEEYGKGSLEGLAASTTANNACLGGALTTMMALGLPGDAVTAILIGAFIIYGVQPGPIMFRDHANFVYMVITLMLLANVVFLAVGFFFSKILTKFLSLPQSFIWATIIILSLVGSYAINNSAFDLMIVFLSGVLGFIFRLLDVPLGPIVLALILGPMAEANMRRALILSGGSFTTFFTRPISLVLLILSAVSLLTSVLRKRKS
ncbi:MAG: tripartite tricarboxylate transporter permease [Pseudothermotoga sp.]|uniref:tripartite tricarboxylate transporter permease n=1 Tax=Pseudothermotoga sp. TaxID=2033661 RepID=UPI00258281A7|nr:tripartite tricarboxylate transporter permease [Pseudothermotoga sp.]MDI6861986.1 tripartite tricarboxylate transporter permease [Pseudothermotoga sp.]